MDGARAEAVGIDPLEARLRNFVRPAQMPYVSVTKKTLDSGDYAAALKRAAELIELHRHARAPAEAASPTAA